MGDHWDKFVKKGEKVFWRHLSLTQDYFAIYHANANLIGQIPKPELRSKIVETYVLLKVLIDYYNQNNRLMGLYSKEEAECDLDVQEFTLRLKDRHYRFRELKKQLSKMLGEELSILSGQNPTEMISNLRSSGPITPQRC